MATYDKPTTSFYVNYGDLDPLAAQASLAPVLIAPRYKLHTISGGTTALLGTYDEVKGSARAWPEVSENSEVDRDSASVKVVNAGLLVADSITGCTVASEAPTMILFPDNIVTTLGNFTISAGDVIQINSTDVTVTNVDYSAGEPVVAAKILVSGATVVTFGDYGADVNDKAESYLVTFSGATTASVDRIAGNAAFNSSVTFSGGTAKITEDIGLDISDAAVSEGTAVLVTAEPGEKIPNKVYVDAVIAAGTYAAGVIKTNLIPQATVDSAYVTTSDVGVTVASGVKLAYGDSEYELGYGDMYVEYRELLKDGAMTLRSNLSNGAAAWAGEVSPDNPMGMMFAAASGATESPFFYMLATTGADEASTIAAIEYVAQFEAAYAFVPYIHTPAVKTALVATIDKFATPTIAQYKHAWLAPAVAKKVQDIFGPTDSVGNTVLGAISADGVLTVYNTSGTGLLSVLPGDTLHYKATDGGVKTYAVVSVTSATTVKLSGVVGDGTVGQIWFTRTNTASGYAKALADEAKALNNYHVNLIGADKVNFVTAGYEDVDIAYLCAALASMRAGLPPHAPMNAMAVPGFAVEDELKWTDVDYTTMNNGGVFVVYNDADDNTVVYHQVTTKTNGTIAEDDSVVSNGEAIIRQLRVAVKALCGGQGNATDQLLNAIRTKLITVLTSIAGEYYPELYGPRILDWEITRLYIPEGNRRSIRCQLDIDLPEPTQDVRFDFNLF